MSEQVLREPTKPETSVGWWFMRRFRPQEVAARKARNRILAEAHLACVRYDLPALSAALNAYADLQDAS